jgi:hypothetical protein
MQTWSLSLKKCSMDRRSRKLLRRITAFAFVAVLSGVLISGTVFAATAPLSEVLLRDIRANHSNSFEKLLTHWEVKYGTDAYPALHKIATNSSNEDTERYIAVMGMAKLGGFASAPALTPFLKDASWMVRNATLRALTALKNPKTSPKILPLVNDRALVIRLEAVEALAALQPSGFEQAWVESIKNPANYHRGKAQWVPQKALSLLIRHLSAYRETRKHVALGLIGVAEHPLDPDLRPALVQAIERISGKRLDLNRPLSESLAQLRAQLKS